MSADTAWDALQRQRALEHPPVFRFTGGKAWRDELHWRLLEDLFVLVNHCPDYPIVPVSLVQDLRERADALIWLVEYLEAGDTHLT